MGKRKIRRQLTTTSKRLTGLRVDLDVTREQILYLVEDADDHETRAIVAENTAATREARQAREHVDAMRRHYDEISAEIERLERRQDELLDELTSAR